MHIPGAKIVSLAEARALIAPPLARHLTPRDLEIALDDELTFADAFDRSGVLILPDEAVIAGDLRLDFDAAEHNGRRYRGILALGALTVEQDIVNDNLDCGPFLVVLGRLSVRHILKGRSPMIVFGPLVSPGMIYCAYNHGSFRAYGGIAAHGIIIDDQSLDIVGPVNARRLALWQPDAAHVLLPEFFCENDAGAVGPVDDLGERLKARIRAGAPIFRDDAAGA